MNKERDGPDRSFFNAKNMKEVFKMNEVKLIKGFFIAGYGVLFSFLGSLTIPVLLMVSCNIIDYVTAIMASPRRGKVIDSDVGIHGIKKKVTMWLLVCVGVLMDISIKYASDLFGIRFPFTMIVSCMVAMWIVCNELISILENINDIGVKTPAFLNKLVSNLKCQIEEKADGPDGNKENQ